ncbi:hypothetical protein D3C75_624260 [compost metagenome]
MKVISIYVVERDMHDIQIGQQLLIPGIRHGQVGINLRPDAPLTGIFEQRHNCFFDRTGPEHRLAARNADGLQMFNLFQAVQHIFKREHVSFFSGQAVANRTMLTPHVA